MTNKEFVEKLKDVATKYKTLYVLGCFGAPLNANNKKRYSTNYAYNKQAARAKMINAASSDTFGFDCVCLIKGILWGWNGDQFKAYGGASYATNGVPDIGADAMIKKCEELSTDFSKIEVGEAVWMSGHIGVYIGNGLAVECSPKWKNCVQITACNRDVAGYNRRNWTKHGKLPYIEYVKVSETSVPTKKTNEEIAKEVINGKWSNGEERKQKLTAAGYNYSDIQKIVNELCSKPAQPAKKSNETIAKEVIDGKWSNGEERKQKLAAAGYDYKTIQSLVNQMLR